MWDKTYTHFYMGICTNNPRIKLETLKLRYWEVCFHIMSSNELGRFPPFPNILLVFYSIFHSLQWLDKYSNYSEILASIYMKFAHDIENICTYNSLQCRPIPLRIYDMNTH